MPADTPTSTPLVIEGHSYWLVNGRLRPVVTGGSDDAPGDTTDAPDDSPGDDTSKDTPKPTDFEADAKKWKALALKHEAKAKANATAAERVKAMEMEGKSETEKLQALLEEERTKAHKATVEALKLRIAAEKGLPGNLAKFLPDVDDEVDMMSAADELLEAAGGGQAAQPARQPKSNLTNPLKDDDGATQRDAILAAMTGRSVS